MNAKLEALQTRMSELQEEMQTEFKTVFTGETKSLFENYKWLKEISWTQYTPYFNDGDTCEFSVHGDDIAINGTTGYSYSNRPFEVNAEDWSSILFDDEDGEAFAKEVNESDEFLIKYQEVLAKAKELTSFLMSNEDIALAMFGDHAKVSVQADGVYVEEYEHD